MKHTEYFLYTQKRPDRARIKEEWISRAINNPLRIQVQQDGRMRKWVEIPEEGKCLRVILLSDGETVHNALFDRTFTIVAKHED